MAGEFKWSNPSKRARKYADDRKARVHTKGPKEGRPLTDFESGIRAGYLQCRSDSAAIYKYKEALNAGKSKAEARKAAVTKKAKAQ